MLTFAGCCKSSYLFLLGYIVLEDCDDSHNS